MQEELGKVIVGQEEVIEQVFAAIFTRGHCLLEGVPGLAKTLMVSTIAKILDVNFKRIQFTPDLMPSDITGTNLLDEDEQGKRLFRFVEGPIFTNILLADEINRTPPKTQAALLQAMQEREVTVGRETYKLKPKEGLLLCKITIISVKYSRVCYEIIITLSLTKVNSHLDFTFDHSEYCCLISFH